MESCLGPNSEIVKMQDLSLGANRTRRSPMDQKVGRAEQACKP